MNGSADISDIISKLTQNPDMMKNLMGVAKNLMNDSNKEESVPTSYSEPKGERECFKEDKKECDVCSNDGHRAMKGDDAENLIRLLLALRPFVSPERCSKIDNIVKILKLVQLSEKTGLLKSLL